MAYRSFTDPFDALSAIGGDTSPAPRTAPATLPSLSALEWSVVAHAARDSLSSLREPGRVAAALGALFGQRHDPRRADTRLEALRRVAVLAWRDGYSIPPSELRAFLEAGFSDEQYDLVQESIGRGRSARNRRLSA
jgi:hypothetical protein